MSYDVAIIGGGHNGLVCAAYLAKAGKSVIVLEARSVVGGAATTEEFHPGFRNSLAAYTVSLLNPKVIRDLKLERFGLKILERKVNNFWPQERGSLLAFHTSQERTSGELAKFSTRDAAELPRYYRDIETGAGVLRSLLLETPPNVGGGIMEYLKAARVGNRFRKLSLEDQQLVLDLFTKSAAEFLEGYFEADAVRAAFAFDSIVGFYGSPYTPGSAYVLLHHAFGEV
ncbi:MAG: NAD(P)/FAD-dependent oxidoreductase, partial [Proteobacteria bacterium]|nr:NAD(P)/FAD-dependent oxidoreductase [Pseudomonadota bacterium]